MGCCLDLMDIKICVPIKGERKGETGGERVGEVEEVAKKRGRGSRIERKKEYEKLVVLQTRILQPIYFRRRNLPLLLPLIP
jgi:hypothetical protein